MTRGSRLVVTLPSGWVELPAESTPGPAVFALDTPEAAGALQVSLQAQYQGGKVPSPSPDALIGFAVEVLVAGGEFVPMSVSSGACAVGLYGTAIGRWSDCPHVQAWVLSDGRDFVLATHIATSEPTARERREAHEIVLGLVLLGLPGAEGS